jgi:hypothetical protein
VRVVPKGVTEVERQRVKPGVEAAGNSRESCQMLYSCQLAIMENIDNALSGFLARITSGEVEVYNEFSLQHELGIHLRQYHLNYLVQFERNISYFGGVSTNFKKREIDISVFTRNPHELHYAMELKFPRNGQIPEQMFSFCKDIQFTEELLSLGFQSASVLVLVEDPLFFQGLTKGIYGYFRGIRPLTGRIIKPTGTKDKEVNIRGKYTVTWHPLRDKLHYFLITVKNIASDS